MTSIRTAAICLGISLLALSAPSRAQSPSPVQQSGALRDGGSYILHRDAVMPTAAMELWFRAPANGYDGRYPGISRLAVAAIAASSGQHGTPLSELVARLGGTLTFAAYPDIVMVGVTVPAAQSSQALRALTGAYFAPSIDADGLKKALQDCAIAAAELPFDSQRAVQDRLFAQIFSAGPAHYPPTPSAADFNNIPGDDLRTYATRAFRQPNALLSLAGNVDGAVLSAVQTHPDGAPMDAPFDSTLAAHPDEVSQTGAEAAIGFAWSGPPIANARAATALDFVADYLFDAEHGTVAQAARKSHSDVFLTGQFITLHNPGVLVAIASGTGASDLRGSILDAVDAMRTPLDSRTFDAARNAFEYRILSQTQMPGDRADNLGWYGAEGNASYAPGDDSRTYVNAAESLDPAFVAQTVRTYLQHPAIVQITAESKQQGTSL